MRKIGLFNNIRAFFFGEKMKIELDDFCFRVQGLSVKQLAIESAINLIANTLCTSEFRCYSKGKETRQENYYTWNVRPNKNQNSTEFFKELVSKLVKNNEVLIINMNDEFFIADSFNAEKYVTKKNKYTDVYVDDMKFNKIFYEEDVFYLKLNNSNMSAVITSLISEYEDLLKYSSTTYKRSNARRGILNIPTSYPKTEKANEDLNKLMKTNFKDFFESENGAVLPLTNGITYQDLTNNTYKNGSDSRDIRTLIDDTFDFVAIGFGIPPAMLKGGAVNSDVRDQYMISCINPIKELLQDEMNSKYFTKEEYLQKSYINIDTSKATLGSIKAAAEAIELLTRNGVNTLDDNLRMLGREPENTEDSTKRHITLNLTEKGGEE